MKEQDFLDELFDKARNEKHRFEPNTFLENAVDPKPGNQIPFKKFLYAAAAGLILILSIIGINSIGNTDQEAKQVLLAKDTIKEIINRTDTIIDLNPNQTDFSAGDNQSFHIDDALKDKKTMQYSVEDGSSMSSPYNKQSQEHIEIFRGEPEKLSFLQKMPVQSFEILADRDTVIKTSDGLRLYFESQSFVNHDGRVIKGPVRLDITNCSSLDQYIREDLSTYADGLLLETAGMFRLEATQGNDTLRIREGYDYGVGLNREIPERMQLYYGKNDSTNGINWKLDPVGKIPAPIAVVTGGKYEKVTDPFFYKNYRFKKSDMLQLLDSSWQAHFTTDNRQIVGKRSCNGEEGPNLSACMTFNEQLATQLAEMDIFNVNSRMTEFKFTCYSKDKYAYAMTKGAIDSVKSYVPPSDYNYLSMPLFFPITTGWVNMDCVPRLEIKWKKLNRVEKTTVKVLLPEALKVKAYLYIPETNSIARLMNSNEKELLFMDIPAGYDVRLIITSFDKEQFVVYSGDFNANGQPIQVEAFTRINELDTYLNWLQSISSSVNNTNNSIR